MEWVLGGLAAASLGAAIFFALRGQAHRTALKAKSDEIDALKSELVAARSQIDQITSVANERALDAPKLEAEVRRAGELRAERDQTRQQAETYRVQLAALQAAHAKLDETLVQERKQADEKLALLNEARERMKVEFKLLAEEVMKGHGETFKKQNKEQIDLLLTPLSERINEFKTALHTAHTESNKERITLAEQIRNLTATSSAMMTETTNLTRALKGESQTQGAWGEMVLESILEKSGLRAGEEYTRQETHAGGDGGRPRTDVIVNLPNGQRVVIDSKVSLTAFESYCNAEDADESAAHLKAHLNSLRTHIKTLSGKDYHAVAGSHLDYVIMFVPIEGALAAALQQDSALTAFAVENNVPIATPTTLMIALRTIANLWQVERRNRNAEDIAKRAGLLYEKFAGFIGDMQSLGVQLSQAQKKYDGALEKLSTGRGNIVRQIEQLKEMGAKTSKVLPNALLDEALADEREPELGLIEGSEDAAE